MLWTTVLVSLAFMLLDHKYLPLVALLASTVYHLNGYLRVKSWQPSKILGGELVHQLLYAAWLFFFFKQQYMYYIPLALSTIGKIHLIWNKNSAESQQLIEELVLFQVKCEVFILGVLTLLLFSLDPFKLLDFVVFAIIMKIKYSFYYPGQKAFLQLHFSLDKLTRRWGCRPIYHLLVMAISNFSSTYMSQRETLY